MNIYVHIPFCHSKCSYCDFLSHCDIRNEDKYIEAVCEEIGNNKYLESASVETIYFGGGTPSIIKPKNIQKVVDAIFFASKLTRKVEITLESNPEDIDADSLASWKGAGINRLSIGVQSLNNKVRKAVNRSLSTKEVLEKIHLSGEYFNHVGIDLIANLPGDTLANDLEANTELLKLVDHVSVYDLELDNNSVLAKNYSKYLFPPEEQSARNLLTIWSQLKTLGYEQYEISNFAKNSNYCQHNLSFWQGKDYLGFGLGATSLVSNRILTNTNDFELYLKGAKQNVELLTEAELKRFRLVSALRLNAGLGKDFGKPISPELIEAGLINKNNALTDQGKLLYNQVVRILNEN